MRHKATTRQGNEARWVTGGLAADVFRLMLTCAPFLTSCTDPNLSMHSVANSDDSTRAMDCLKAALRYEANPAVRVQAVEALQDVRDPEVLPWIRSAMLDDHPGVRFAACLAVGRNRDAGASSGLANGLSDADPSVRLAAIYAHHRLGRTERTGELAGALLTHRDPAVRRNAAFILGLLGEPGGVKVLAKAMKDSDAGVRQHALEAMARLGNTEAKQELSFRANSGVGADELFAVSALSARYDRALTDTFRFKLENGAHIETRLAAAKALGMLGDASGFQTAISALRSPKPGADTPEDPAPAQTLRIQQLAAGALGAIRQPRALPDLRHIMDRSNDPRVQVSAAKAILEIHGPLGSPAEPVAHARTR
jgi:HEAT repeat protein